MSHKETLDRIIKYLMINYPFVADIGLMNGCLLYTSDAADD